MPKYKTQTNDLTEVIETGGGGKKLYMHKVGIYQTNTGFIVYTYDPTPKTKVKDYMKYMFNDADVTRYPCYPNQIPINGSSNIYVTPYLLGRTGDNPYFYEKFGRLIWNDATNSYDKVVYDENNLLEKNTSNVTVIEVQ